MSDLKKNSVHSSSRSSFGEDDDDDEDDDNNGSVDDEEGSFEAVDATAAAAHALSNLNRSSQEQSYASMPVLQEACGYPFPPNYRIPNSKPTRTGRWTLQEHKVFLKGTFFFFLNCMLESTVVRSDLRFQAEPRTEKPQKKKKKEKKEKKS
jgi:hypothetical protein